MASAAKPRSQQALKQTPLNGCRLAEGQPGCEGIGDAR